MYPLPRVALSADKVASHKTPTLHHDGHRRTALLSCLATLSSHPIYSSSPLSSSTWITSSLPFFDFFVGDSVTSSDSSLSWRPLRFAASKYGQSSGC